MEAFYHTVSPRQARSRLPTGYAYPRHARMTLSMIRTLSNGERLVLEGLRFALKDHESMLVTSATIARWANVSESTVSRAIPGLARHGYILIDREVCATTGRKRWNITLLPPPECTTKAEPLALAESDATTDEGSDVDASGDDVVCGVEMPHSTLSDASVLDLSNILDSCSCMQQQADPASQSDSSVRYAPDEEERCLRPDGADGESAHAVVAESIANKRPDLVFPAAWHMIQAHNPTYSPQDFGRDLVKAQTRRDIRNPVGLVVECARRNEPVLGLAEVQARCTGQDGLAPPQPDHARRSRRMPPAQDHALPNAPCTAAAADRARQIIARARAIAPPDASELAIQSLALDLEDGLDEATAVANLRACQPGEGGGT